MVERMFPSVRELRRAVQQYVTDFDAALITTSEAATVVEHASAIEAMAATLKGLAAARMAEGGAWRRDGHRSPAHHLAQATGTSVGQAANTIETAKRLAELPATETAARTGKLSPQQASAIAEAASADPQAEKRLLEKSERASLPELREECARTRAAALPDAEARRRRIHESRHLREFVDGEGAWNLRMRDNPEVGARVMAAVNAERDRLFREARAEGRREPSEAYAADALVSLVTRDNVEGTQRRGGGAKIVARVDLPALLRGYPIEGEVCEIVGYGPVAVSALRDMIDTGDPFLAAVITKGVEVIGVAHLGRRPNAVQQTALEWLYPSCAVLGCNAVARLENDHREDWHKTHVTVLDLLDRLCEHHHDLKTLERWALVAGEGKRPFVPPGHPRHPGMEDGRTRPPPERVPA